ncbi:MAG: Maf family protein [Actinomycetota bacterium]
MIRLVLASSSPARLQVLRAAGIDPEIVLPQVDEEALTQKAIEENPDLLASELVQLLAKAKASSIQQEPSTFGKLILGGDSALEFEGKILGKPHDPAVAKQRWLAMNGKFGVLHSGHHLIDNRDPKNPKEIGRSSATGVYFSTLTSEEIDDYVATKEPLKVAGAFTIDGLGGAFIDKIEGDFHTVVGLSLRVLREMSRELGIHYPSLWR